MDRRAASPYARDESLRRIFAVLGIPPEELAYTMAAYSRSKRSFLETNAFITGQKAADFLETFYFAYGHRSIADMAHVPFAIENVSILAAIEIVAESLWDGQERSTRYQDFSVTGYLVPDEIVGSDVEALYIETADALFEAYEKVSQAAYRHYLATVPKPEGMEQKDYERTLRARAFDVGRYLLPLATHTSVGQITSARTLEKQISRLLSSPFGEVRRVGEALRDAGRSPARSPRDERALTLVEQLASSENAAIASALKEALAPAAAAPTLVKYTAPDRYRLETQEALRRVYEGLLGQVPVGITEPVSLVEVDDPAVEAVAKLLYGVGRHPFSQIVLHVQTLTRPEIRELLELAFEKRGPHDEWLAEFRTGYLNFDIVMDIGSYRDLHRHRRCHQLRQAWTTRLGYEEPDVVRAAGVQETYREAMARAFQAAQHIDEAVPPLGAYLLPLGTRCRALFSMDLAELAYIAELRTRPTGHFSYRRVAYDMYRKTVERYPDFAPFVRVVDPDYEDLTER
ncbi:MAG: FAD-dependent thymidylate synthase [Clostridia bacterium]|nr:alternative thymidylate synthase [Bacillota bacterium]MBO2520384.1 alternative thymidylate synthase [Bacillota bacterium]